MHVAMIGTGYVGLISGACFSEFGFDVVCVDKDEDKIACLSRCEIPIYEPGLSALIESNVERGRLSILAPTCGGFCAAGSECAAVHHPLKIEKEFSCTWQ